MNYTHVELHPVMEYLNEEDGEYRHFCLLCTVPEDLEQPEDLKTADQRTSQRWTSGVIPGLDTGTFSTS